MRYLHAIAAHEVFVGQGVYLYYEDDTLTGEKERWTLHELPGGARFFRVDADTRDATHGGFSRLAEALYSPAGELVRYNFHYFDNSTNPPHELPDEVLADYTVMDDYVQIGYRSGHDERVYEEFSLPEGAILSPHGFIFTGRVIQQALKQAEADRNTDTVNLVDLDYHVYGRMAQVSPVTVRLLRVESLQFGRASRETRCYEMARSGGEPHLYWLDSHDIVVQYEHRTGDGLTIRVRLTNYAHR